MKRNVQRVVFLIMSVAVINFIGFSSAEAEVIDFGDICLFLNPDFTWDHLAGDKIQVGVLSFGSGHFALHGRTSGIEGYFSDILHGPAHGTAMIDGTNIVMSLTISSVPDIKNIAGSFSELYIVLNNVDLSGRYLEMRGTAPGSQGGGFVAVVECT